MSKVIDTRDGYTYDAESGTYECKRCGLIFGPREDRDPAEAKEAHEAICEEVAEADERLRSLPPRRLGDTLDDTGLISGGW